MFVSRNIFDIIKEIINSSKQYIDIRYIGNDTEFITADTVAVTNVVKIIVDKISSVNNGFISKPVSVSIVNTLKVIKVGNHYAAAGRWLIALLFHIDFKCRAVVNFSHAISKCKLFIYAVACMFNEVIACNNEYRAGKIHKQNKQSVDGIFDPASRWSGRIISKYIHSQEYTYYYKCCVYFSFLL